MLPPGAAVVEHRKMVIVSRVHPQFLVVVVVFFPKEREIEDPVFTRMGMLVSFPEIYDDGTR